MTRSIPRELPVGAIVAWTLGGVERIGRVEGRDAHGLVVVTRTRGGLRYHLDAGSLREVCDDASVKAGIVNLIQAAREEA